MSDSLYFLALFYFHLIYYSVLIYVTSFKDQRSQVKNKKSHRLISFFLFIFSIEEDHSLKVKQLHLYVSINEALILMHISRPACFSMVLEIVEIRSGREIC